MRCFRTGSAALLALTVISASAGGQPSTKIDPTPKKADKPVSTTDALIANALASDPDVRMALAKMQLAEAELAKARLTATLKVTALVAAIEQHKVALEVAQKRMSGLVQIPGTAEFLDARLVLARTQAALATAEAELKLLTGTPGGQKYSSGVLPLSLPPTDYNLWSSPRPDGDKAHNAELLTYYTQILRQSVKGPVPDQLRAALDKPVKLGAKGEAVKFKQALEVFKKEAGLDITVRGEVLHRHPLTDAKTGQPLLNPNGEVILTPLPEIVSEGETLPIGAWFQLFQDECGGRLYVREYGLLFTKAAPPDAPTLTEFWKQKPPAPKPEPKPEPGPMPK